MNLEEFKCLPDGRVGHVLLDISELDDQGDRTLFYGTYYLRDQRVTHHTYVKDCRFHVVIYATGHELLACVSSRELSALVMVPKMKLEPAYCDFQAAEYFLNFGADVQFVDEHTPIQQRQFAGSLLEDLEPLHLRFHGGDSLKNVKARPMMDFLDGKAVKS